MSESWVRQWPRRTTPVVLAVLAVVVLRLMSDRHPAISGFEFWMPLGVPFGFLLCALILWAGNRYVDGPGREGFWLLTVLPIVVSALRIDFGVYVAVASLATLFVRHVRDGAQVFG